MFNTVVERSISLHRSFAAKKGRLICKWNCIWHKFSVLGAKKIRFVYKLRNIKTILKILQLVTFYTTKSVNCTSWKIKGKMWGATRCSQNIAHFFNLLKTVGKIYAHPLHCGFVMECNHLLRIRRCRGSLQLQSYSQRSSGPLKSLILAQANGNGRLTFPTVIPQLRKRKCTFFSGLFNYTWTFLWQKEIHLASTRWRCFSLLVYQRVWQIYFRLYSYV